MLPDELQHQELVKIGVEQRPGNRVQLPVVVVRPLGEVNDHRVPSACYLAYYPLRAPLENQLPCTNAAFFTRSPCHMKGKHGTITLPQDATTPFYGGVSPCIVKEPLLSFAELFGVSVRDGPRHRLRKAFEACY